MPAKHGAKINNKVFIGRLYDENRLLLDLITILFYFIYLFIYLFLYVYLLTEKQKRMQVFDFLTSV